MIYHRRYRRTLKLRSSGTRLLAVLHFSLLLVLSAAAHVPLPAPIDKNIFVTDADMGVYTYDTIIEVSGHPVNVRLHLRFMCDGDTSSGSAWGGSTSYTQGSSSSSSSISSSISIEGFVSTYLLTTKPPPWAAATPHYYPLDILHRVNVSTSSR